MTDILFPPLEDIYYGDVVAGDYIYDRSISRFTQVVEVVERNAVEVELRLWGGDSLVAERDTLITRAQPVCPTCGDDRDWCPRTDQQP